MALIYRAYFAFANNHRYNSKGLNTSAMFGFTNTLLEVLQKEKPTHIAVVFGALPDRLPRLDPPHLRPATRSLKPIRPTARRCPKTFRYQFPG